MIVIGEGLFFCDFGVRIVELAEAGVGVEGWCWSSPPAFTLAGGGVAGTTAPKSGRGGKGKFGGGLCFGKSDTAIEENDNGALVRLALMLTGENIPAGQGDDGAVI